MTMGVTPWGTGPAGGFETPFELGVSRPGPATGRFQSVLDFFGKSGDWATCQPSR